MKEITNCVNVKCVLRDKCKRFDGTHPVPMIFPDGGLKCKMFINETK